MLRLVTSHRPELRGYLASTPFLGVELDHVEAESIDDLRRRVWADPPGVVIVDATLPGGFELCRDISEAPELPHTQTIAILPSAVDRDVLDRLAAARCGDVLMLPVHADEFYYRVAQQAGLPIRRDRRVGVSLRVAIPGYGDPIEGAVLNVSSGGVGVQLSGRLEPGLVVQLSLSHDGTTYPDTDARIAWVRPDAGGQLAGLSFDQTPPVRTLILLEQLALYDISPLASTDPIEDGVSAALQGDFTEISDFRGLAARLAREVEVVFNAAAVRYISSAGVRAWCEFLAGLADRSYSFRHLSLAFASQASMVPLVIGHGPVRSAEAPYLCETCDREELRLVDLRAVVCDRDGVRAPSLTCTTCKQALVLDDLPERYFAFLTH